MLRKPLFWVGQCLKLYLKVKWFGLSWLEIKSLKITTSVQPWSLEINQAQNNLSDIFFWPVLWFFRPGWGFLITMNEDIDKGNEKIWGKKGSELKLYGVDAALTLILLKDLSAAVFTPAWTAQPGSGFLFLSFGSLWHTLRCMHLRSLMNF